MLYMDLSLFIFIDVMVIFAIALVCFITQRIQRKRIYKIYDLILLSSLRGEAIDNTMFELVLNKNGNRKLKKALFGCKDTDNTYEIKNMFFVTSLISNGGKDPCLNGFEYNINNLVDDFESQDCSSDFFSFGGENRGGNSKDLLGSCAGLLQILI